MIFEKRCVFDPFNEITDEEKYTADLEIIAQLKERTSLCTLRLP